MCAACEGQKLFLSFCHVGPGAQTQGIRLDDGKHLYRENHLDGLLSSSGKSHFSRLLEESNHLEYTLAGGKKKKSSF